MFVKFKTVARNSLTIRAFGPSERQRERRLRVNTSPMKLKNFTKHADF